MSPRKNKKAGIKRPKLLCEELSDLPKSLFHTPFQQRISQEVLQNLRHPLREYQLEALGRFDFYRKTAFPGKPQRTDLLFHMATGSGKTLVIAANILQLFKEGYYDFIFFVNSTNIIEKTRDNFLVSSSSKYLFADRIEMEGKTIEVAEVSSFSESVPGRINIVFTTIQGLHSALNTPRENSITFRDFEGRRIVLLSDETHHLNAMTKLRDSKQNLSALERDDFTGFDLSKLKKEELESLRSWEGTVVQLFKSHPENILLEYTATIDLDDSNILAKYQNKIIFQYDLRQYRKDGYSKEIEVLQADLSPLDRALQAVILSQYRRHLAAKHKISLKPVILFKANFINSPKRQGHGDADIIILSEFKEKFHEKISSLKSQDIEEIKMSILSQEQTNLRLRQAFEFFDKQNVSSSELVESIREEFDPSRCLSVNDDGEDRQQLLNSLEDGGNRIRAVFAVEKLNEGWDVLNLFDIVRLYDTRDARQGKPGEKTIREAQLIGRGARYCPFSYQEGQKDKRKFDSDETNELRVLEELFFHSKNNPKYIQELKQAMIFTGIIPKETKSLPVKIKESFKKTSFWKKGQVFLNEKVKLNNKDVLGLAKHTCETPFEVKLFTGRLKEGVFFDEVKKKTVSEPSESQASLSFKEIPVSIIRKSLDQNEFFHFDNLKRYFPNLESINKFITDDLYLACIKVDVFGKKEQIKNISREDFLFISNSVLGKIRDSVINGWHEFKGTREFKPVPIRELIKDKVLNIVVDEDSDKEFGIAISETKNSSLKIPIGEKGWYIYDENFGTSVEKEFLRYFDQFVSEIEKSFSEFFLLRNEKLFQLYRFEDGRTTEPDFVLFFRENKTDELTTFQIFIEAKGQQLIEQDKWKEDLLLSLESEVEPKIFFENKEVRIVGLPFFTNFREHTPNFEEEFQKRFLPL